MTMPLTPSAPPAPHTPQGVAVRPSPPIRGAAVGLLVTAGIAVAFLGFLLWGFVPWIRSGQLPAADAALAVAVMGAAACYAAAHVVAGVGLLRVRRWGAVLCLLLAAINVAIIVLVIQNPAWWWPLQVLMLLPAALVLVAWRRRGCAR